MVVVIDRDGIHLSNEGSKIVAKEILKVLREADWEPSLDWKSMPVEFAEDSPYEPIGADENTHIDSGLVSIKPKMPSFTYQTSQY